MLRGWFFCLAFVSIGLESNFKDLAGQKASVIIWTTTPWTLPSNLALAVGEDIDYSYCESDGQTLIVAEALREAVFRDIEHSVVRTVKGSDLVGTRYERLFDYLEVDAENAFTVMAADFVSTEDGTGTVVTCDDGRVVRSTHAVLAIGSVPNTDALGLDAAGVETVGQLHRLPHVTKEMMLADPDSFRDPDIPTVNIQHTGGVFQAIHHILLDRLT